MVSATGCKLLRLWSVGALCARGNPATVKRHSDMDNLHGEPGRRGPSRGLGLHSLACDVPHSGWLKPWVGAGREKGAGTQKGPVWTRPPSGEQLLGRTAMTGSEDLGWAQPGSPGPGDTHCPKPRGAVHWLVAEKAPQELGCPGEPLGLSLLPQKDLLWLKLQDHADRTGRLTWENEFL